MKEPCGYVCENSFQNDMNSQAETELLMATIWAKSTHH